MKRTMINALQTKENQVVKVSGWVHRIRKLKSVVFVILRDRSGLVQLIMSPESFKKISLKLEAVVEVTGKVTSSPNKYGPFETHVESLNLLSEVVEDLPLQINGDKLDSGLENILNHRVLSLRHSHESAIFKIQAAIGQAFESFLRQADFIQIHTPKLVKEGAEGGSNVFSLDYFGETAYLAQSPQFYKQMMVASGLERVFEIGSVFRAESHSTSRHLNEYISLDLEMGFIECESELMDLETQLLKHIMNHLQVQCLHELELLSVTLPRSRVKFQPLSSVKPLKY